MINLILYIATSENEQQYYFHVLEVRFLNVIFMQITSILDYRLCDFSSIFECLWVSIRYIGF